jgi:hypothetical protein
MDQSLTKKQFIDSMRVERARWEMLLLRVGPGRMCMAVGGEGYSVAELVGTLYERERRLVGLLASAQGLTAPIAGVQARDAGSHSAARVVEASREAFNEILRLLVPVSEADLFGKGRFPWSQGRTLAEVVAACTINYYVEHDGSIRSWLSQPVVQAV